MFPLLLLWGLRSILDPETAAIRRQPPLLGSQTAKTGFIQQKTEVKSKQSDDEDMHEILRRTDELAQYSSRESEDKYKLEIQVLNEELLLHRISSHHLDLTLKTTLVDLDNEKQKNRVLEVQIGQLQNESASFQKQRDDLRGPLEQEIKILNEQVELQKANQRHLDETWKTDVRELDNEKRKCRELEMQLKQFQNENVDLLKQRDELREQLEGEINIKNKELLSYRASNHHVDDTLKTTIIQLDNAIQNNRGLETQPKQFRNKSVDLPKQTSDQPQELAEALMLLHEKADYHPPSETKLNELPLELLDAILEKSLLHWMLQSPTHQRDEDIIRVLISVDFCFRQRITGRRFKKRIWTQLKGFSMSRMEWKDEHNKVPSSSTIYDLPLEMLDVILQKSYLHWILNPPVKQRDAEVIRSLISVDVCFNQRITRQRFKKTTWRCLKALYGKTKQRRAIIRNNRDYLVDNIQPNDEFIASLLRLSCITDEQIHLIQRRSSKRYKNDRLLYVMESADEISFSNFIKSLRHTNQETVERIIENGGGVIKIEVEIHDPLFPASNELFHQKIEDLRNREKPRSHETDTCLVELRDKGVKILNSQLDKQTAVVWIWCRTQAGLENIMRLHKSNQLRDVYFENVQPSTSKMINIDRNQFRKIVVLCPIRINFTQKFRTNEIEEVHGVTKLQHEIYVLYKKNVILVFEDQRSFSLIKTIEINEMRSPWDIGSNEKDNCLYISDYTERCIWKITKETDDQHNIILLFHTGCTPEALSVSSDGQLLMINNSSHSLMIRGSDATLIRSIPLPTSIRRPRHAVETSIGNFIIIHVEESAKELTEEGQPKEWLERNDGKSASSGRSSVDRTVVSELTRDGHVIIRRFISPDATQNTSEYLSLDSDDRVFVVDTHNDRVILLDSDLKWNRILCPTKEESKEMISRGTYRLWYDEEMKQLIVGNYYGFNVYTLSRN